MLIGMRVGMCLRRSIRDMGITGLTPGYAVWLVQKASGSE